MLENLSNYRAFSKLVQTGSMTVDTSEIDIYNWDDYYVGLLNILKDGIETDFVQTVKIDVIFRSPNGMQIKCKLAIVDLYFNLILWYMIVRAGDKIEARHLVFEKNFTKSTIKRFIDTHYIARYKKKVSIKEMNNTIDESLHYFMDVDNFSMYLANTINLEDFISLMKASPRFDQLMNADLSDVPIEDVKDYGMKLANESIDIIENSEKIMGFKHCLVDSFRAKEGITPKQYKEFAINIGSKPDGKGGVHPAIINNSYLNGGLDSFLYQFIDSASSRYAQLITKNYVGDSGNFARIVGLNNINTFLNDDETYDCHTRNFVVITISSLAMLKLYVDRYYRLDPEGIEYVINSTDEFLIGKTIYLRSPETCASEARGHGVCFKCYGDSAYTNRNIKPGKMAAELITSKTTQERLSSKHILETKIKKFKWNENFMQFMQVELNSIKLNVQSCSDDMFIIIDPASIMLENQDDYEKTEYIDEDDNNSSSNDDDDSDTSYNEYLCEFFIGKDGTDELKSITSEDGAKMYISISLNNLIRSVGIPTEDKKIKIRISDIEDSILFFIKIKNNELGKSLTDIQNLLDKISITKAQTIDTLTQKIVEASIEGNMGIMAIHFEILIMNQIRNAKSHLHKPNWDRPNEPYEILTLKQSLMDNPSVTISLLFQYLGRALYYPLTFKKNKPSFMDLFFAKRVQSILSDSTNIVDTTKKPKRISPATRIHKREE